MSIDNLSGDDLNALLDDLVQSIEEAQTCFINGMVEIDAKLLKLHEGIGNHRPSLKNSSDAILTQMDRGSDGQLCATVTPKKEAGE